MNTGGRRMVPRAPLCICVLTFHHNVRTTWAWLSVTQELCPSGLVSSDAQDFDQALTSTATATLSDVHICRSISRRSSEPYSSFVDLCMKEIGRERRQKAEEGRFGGRWWEKHLEKCEGPIDGMHWKKNLLGTPRWLNPVLFYLQFTLLHWPVKTSTLEE